jgi:lantibiotic leader peptide-processing serine protease
MLDNNIPIEYQWNISRLTKNGEVYKFSRGVSTVKVALIDSGIDYNHETLSQNIDFINSKNFIGESDDIIDLDGHGTMVAGIISGKKRLIGIAPHVSLVIYKITNKRQFKLIYLLRAIEHAINCKVDVINLSLSMYIEIEQYHIISAMNSLIERAYKAGILIVTSSGNKGIDLDKYGKVHVMGFHPKVFTIAASNKRGDLGSYSNYSSKCLLAPGGESFLDSDDPNDIILTTYPKDLHDMDSLRENLGFPSGYMVNYGTSLACAHFSGTIALLISYYLELSGEKPTIEEIQSFIKRSFNLNCHDQASRKFREINTYSVLKTIELDYKNGRLKNSSK